MEDIARLSSELIQKIKDHEQDLKTRVTTELEKLALKTKETQNELNKEREKLNEEKKLLELEKTKFSEQQQKIEACARGASDVIRLCVGGTIFMAYRDTLLVENSFFYSMLGSSNWKPNFDGAYFIDRDPTHFARILHFLRTGTWNLSSLSKHEMEELKVECDFYQITITQYILPEWEETSLVKVSNNNHDVQNNHTQSNWHMVTTKPLSTNEEFKCILAEIKWTIEILEIGDNNFGMIGAIPNNGSIPNGNHFSVCGGGIYYNSRLYSKWQSKQLVQKSVIIGSKILFVWNLAANTLRISVDDVAVAEFISIETTIKPCICFYGKGSKARLI